MPLVNESLAGGQGPVNHRLMPQDFRLHFLVLLVE